jgi:hypothetical protein
LPLQRLKMQPHSRGRGRPWNSRCQHVSARGSSFVSRLAAGRNRQTPGVVHRSTRFGSVEWNASRIDPIRARDGVNSNVRNSGLLCSLWSCPAGDNIPANANILALTHLPGNRVTRLRPCFLEILLFVLLAHQMQLLIDRWELYSPAFWRSNQ